MRKVIFLIVVLLLAGNISLCYGEESIVSQGKEADIKRLLDLTVTDSLFEAWTNQFMQYFSQIASIERTSEEKELIEIISVVVRDTIFEERSSLIGELIPLYGEYYSHQEIKEIIEFYESPVGRKTMRIMPEILKRSAEMGERWGISLAPKIITKLKENPKTRVIIEHMETQQ